MKILVDILRGQLSDLFLQMSETGLSGVDASEESEVDMFLGANQFFFFDKIGLYVLEVASVNKLDEIISMKVGCIAIMP
mgnify:CR=1 FL=1